MPNNRDLPPDFKSFNSTFELLARRYDYVRVFQDFLDFTIKGLSPWDDFTQLDTYGQATYSKGERLSFGGLIYEWVRLMDKSITSDTEWFDALGIFYETLASRGKKSALGQFFTPSHVCDLVNALSGFKNQGALINEPCCGSGRFILSSHVANLGNYYYAQDLDVMCCKMTAINMCIHGAVGVVVNQDVLAMSAIQNSWVINETLNNTGVPSIRRIDANQVNYFYHLWAKSDRPVLQKKVVETSDPIETVFTLEKAEQLSLF